ncbi:DUF547 domain-containing protein [Myxococcota bacterium]|nr:DUF547 domain-containing protein [Myxococcota bacterium]
MSFVALALSAVISSVPGQVPADAAATWAELLSKRVVDGRVDYRAIEKEDLPKLDRYLAAVAAAKVPSERLAAIAFYVDAYNALVVRAVIRHGRPRSVLDVKDFFAEKVHVVAGQKLSLDDLEKSVLNPFARDPRTHMVLVCAAVGCPRLEPTPMTGSDVEARLDRATRAYLASPTGAIAKPGELQLSKIFDWYAADFGGPSGALTFVKRHLAPEALARLGEAAKISFIDYNWTLNQQ